MIDEIKFHTIGSEDEVNVPCVGIEPTTVSLKGSCSTN